MSWVWKNTYSLIKVLTNSIFIDELQHNIPVSNAILTRVLITKIVTLQEKVTGGLRHLEDLTHGIHFSIRSPIQTHKQQKCVGVKETCNSSVKTGAGPHLRLACYGKFKSPQSSGLILMYLWWTGSCPTPEGWKSHSGDTIEVWLQYPVTFENEDGMLEGSTAREETPRQEFRGLCLESKCFQLADHACIASSWTRISLELRLGNLWRFGNGA